MSTTAVYLPTLRCSCSAHSRRSVRSPKTSSSKKLPKFPNPKTKQRILHDHERAPSIPPIGNPYSGGGGEATSYSRLPLKDDFSSSFDVSSATVIKLSDLVAPAASSREDVYDEKSALGNTGFEYSEEEGEVVEYADEYDGDEEVWEFEDGELVAEEGKALAFADGDDDFAEEDMDEEGKGRKKKGVPAVMRCFDTAKIYVKAGDGGNGAVAFRREKYVPYGGPSGGEGGRGGNVYVEVDGSMNSLLPFRKCLHFRAGRGGHGQGRKQAGAKGEDVVVKVARGTVIREAGQGGLKGEVLLELMHPGQKALLLPGGRGGRGNASFKSGLNKAPKFAERGEEGAEMWLDLELKLVADVGIVGAPNAGKSTLLSAISAARPAIANYPFTTLLPNLGVVSLDFDASMVVADLPGLLEGAHRGFGLGHAFLRHIERCSTLVSTILTLCLYTSGIGCLES